ncbi:hypothetical protein FRB94_014385 [Tulasnella sp. JGI-2019a]|nr:hypothetical protein FRB94_014385 [Tulasnella sp. JGI-2019a]KAG9008629.1 hypothetical protein FRB93_006548 [Tulasnella sp. JGI-2019a]KAG9038495.1 hypothetical protein FRB95_001352 [Tulasnella sp. JGI-2019a]
MSNSTADLIKMNQLNGNGSSADVSQPGFPTYHRKFANPGPLGLFSFASTTLILSFFNLGARGIATPNLIVGMAIGLGGFVQLLAGMWEFAAGNTFGATAFSSYGGFWISFALIFWPGSGIAAAYTDAGEFHSALGIYLMAWFTFTFIMFLATFKSSGALVAVFFFLTVTFALLGAAELSGIAALGKWGGGFGVVTALCAYYTGAAGLYSEEASYVQLPILPLNRPRY